MVKSQIMLYLKLQFHNLRLFLRDNQLSKPLLKNYVPFYGSSELSRMDALHPSVLAYKYKRNYRPFLLGGPGSQSLTHFFTMQETVNQLSNKKAVFIISPQWFTKQDKIQLLLACTFLSFKLLTGF